MLKERRTQTRRWMEVCLYRWSPFVSILLDPSEPKAPLDDGGVHTTEAKTHSLVIRSEAKAIKKRIEWRVGYANNNGEMQISVIQSRMNILRRIQ